MDLSYLRKDFPLLGERDVCYLDNAATTQKPLPVIEACRDYYLYTNANPHRGMYSLSVESTLAYEKARKTIADFLGAKVSELIFTKSATESLNLVAHSFGGMVLQEGDEVILGITEHHSNFVPWQQLCKRRGVHIRYFHCDGKGYLYAADLAKLITSKTKILAITQMSNVLGMEYDVKTFAQMIHAVGGYIVVDGTQSVPHIPVNLADLDLDFFAFSGHKLFGPMGVGVLYGKRKHLETMPPFLYGGDMVESVSVEDTSFAEVPQKFEGGTANVEAAVGLASAVDYLQEIGWERLLAAESRLTCYALNGMKRIPHVQILGSDSSHERHGILAFAVEGVHPHDIAEIMSANNIAIRAGHHCAQPLVNHMGHSSCARISLAFYNTEAEIDRFLECLAGLRRYMGYAD